MSRLRAFLDDLAAGNPPAGAKPAQPATYEPIGERFEPTRGASFDLGPTVDDTNLLDAGGYPPLPVEGSPFLGDDPSPGVHVGHEGHDLDDAPAAPCGCKSKRSKVRRGTSIRYSFTTTDSTPLVVTPSGIEAEDVVSVTLVCSAASAVRLGFDSNGAQAGAFLPLGPNPLALSTGPVWLVGGQGVAATVDVFVEYLAD